MNLLSFVHPIRTYQPCSGVGRHANNVLLRLAERDELRQELFFSAEWLREDDKLDPSTPLREGHPKAAGQYFETARHLDGERCVTGNFPYPALETLFGPHWAEQAMDVLKSVYHWLPTRTD